MEREELFDIYDDTIVTAWDGREWVDPGPACVERAVGAVVLTAWNPGWERPAREVNEEANRRLEAELAHRGWDFWPAVGASRHDDHSEPGFLVWGMSPEDGCALARDFGQFAIYVYDADGMRVTCDCA